MRKNTRKRVVLIFGTFDELHDGHRFFLREARRHGDYLIAVVARDAVVEKLKGKQPRQPFKKRLAGLLASGLADDASPGDDTLGLWSAIKRYSPDLVALGYDQMQLEKELRVFIKKEHLSTELVTIAALHPDRLHSRFRRKK